jgi:2,4-dienoyl-CoA reductase-like NADH-dependent reductase (Old Yellow Enzyme family)
MNFTAILQPFRLGHVTISNRIVFPAFQTNFATSDGFVTEPLLRMYGNIARGGCGLIITGCIAVSDDGVPATNVLKATTDEHIEPLRELFSIIRQNGAVPGVQLMHAGRQTLSAITGHPLVASSPIPCPLMQEMPHELDEAGIARIQDDFVDAAGRLKEAGVELIELHGAFGYLIGGFLSPYSNKRKDKYGMDRTLFFTEIIKKVRQRVGDIAISCRISGDEFVEGGLTLDLTRSIARQLMEAGADIISVSGGTYGSIDHMTPTLDMGEGLHVYLAEDIRRSTGVPVMCAGNIRSLELAEEIVSKGRSDLVCIGRSQLADPSFVKKSINGESINACEDSRRCMFFLNNTPSVSCPQNPEL